MIIGYCLGGPAGIGTFVLAATIGFSVQLAFRIGKYDSKATNHMNLLDLYKNLTSNASDAENQDNFVNE